MISPTEGWAFPETNVFLPDNGPHPAPALRYANGQWRWEKITTSPQIYGISGLTMVSATQGWAVGVVTEPLVVANGVATASANRPLYYDAGAWTVVGG